ncbi:MAG TPA: efflux RND transporter permease subunit, partial [Pirellulales bacterium]|nr:efflux RND transporter permease subunit [Pirellulales bacterium]
IVAYVLSRSFVPARCAAWLKPHVAHGAGGHGVGGHGDAARPKGLFARWEALIEAAIRWYTRRLNTVMKHRRLTLGVAMAGLLAVVVGLGSQLKREFFPEVDAGAFEIAVRVKKTGTRIERSEDRIKRVEEKVIEVLGGYASHGQEEHPGEGDLDTIISELGVTPDWSAAYTPNGGPMDTIMKVQLAHQREKSAQEYVRELRHAFGKPEFDDLEFAFDAGGMIRGAMNEGKSTPINIRIEAKQLDVARQVAEKIKEKVVDIDGVVDCRIMQRLDYPQYRIDVRRDMAANAGLTQTDVMKNVVAALNSSIQFNKHNFWIDPKTHNQYFVGVQYPETDIKSIDTLLNIQITGPNQKQPNPLSNFIDLVPGEVPAEVNHNNLAPSVDLVMGVDGRDLGHVAGDVYAVLEQFGEPRPGERGVWTPYEPAAEGGQRKTIEGAKLVLSGEYSRMQETFVGLGFGSIASVTLIYFLMVALFRSYITPLVVISAVPVGVVGVVLMLFFTGTPINVQSILGVIFMVGIVVSNTVLLTDFAQHIRDAQGLNPTDAIAKAASVRVRPVVMTALAAFFALLPMALAIERGSEANAPLGRAVIGGLLAGLVTTLFVVPCLYSLVVPDDGKPAPR